MTDNKLIANFMGIDIPDQNRTTYHDKMYGVHPKFLKCIKYHSSWYWLIPVIEKIEQNYAHLYYDYGLIIDTKGSWKIKNAYQAVVKFIKWYNNRYYEN